MLTLEFQKRIKADSLEKVRKTGKIPAVFYGPKQDSTPIILKDIDFRKAWKEAGESSIIVLKNGDEEHEALIHDVDLNPVTGAPRHADFYIIEKGKKLQVNVQLEFTGVSPAVKDLGAILVKVLHEVEIEAMPKDLPHDLTIDISSLATVDSQILAKDIVLPSGVELITKPEEVIAAVAVAKEEIEEPTKTIADIELVDQKGKEPTEGEGGEAPAEEKK